MFIKDLIKMPLYDVEEGAPTTEQEVIEEVVGEEEDAENEEDEEVIEEIIEEEEPKDESDEDKEARLKKEKEDKTDTETTDEQKKDSVIKQALAKHPKLFKEFPELRSAYFEHKQFKEVFTSVDEAKEAVNNSQILQKVSEELQAGNPKQVVEYLKEAPKVLTQFTRNLIEELPKEVFSDAIAPSIISMLKEIKEVAVLHKNADLENSVGWISKYLFNNHELPTIKKEEAPKANEEDNKVLTQLAKDFVAEVEEVAKTELDTAIDGSLSSLKNVKPAVRKTIVIEIKDELDEQLGKDAAHNQLMKKLWADAKKSNYSRQSKASIKSAFLAAVNKRLPEVRATVLKNNGYAIKKGQKKTTTTEENVSGKFVKNSNSSSNTSSQDDKVAKLKKEGKSERQILDELIK